MATQLNAPDPPEAQGSLGDAYQRYRLELTRFFELNSRDPNAVDDLMQTMYLQLTSQRTGAPVRDPQRYLFRTAWNLLHTVNRRERNERGRELKWEIDEFDLHADRSNRLWVEDDASLALQQDEIERTLAELPHACRVAMLRQYRDNRSYKQIASELGVSVHAVKKYIVRALNHFRMHFNSMDDAEARERSEP